MKYIFCTLVSLPLAFSAPATSDNTNNPHARLARWQKSGQSAGLYITWWGNENCHNQLNGGIQAIYGSDTKVNMASYSLSRDLAPNEQLDFSIAIPGSQSLINDNDPQAPTECAQFVSSAGPGNRSEGCHNTPESVGCFRLWAQ